MAHHFVPKKLSVNMNMCEGPLLGKIIAFAVPLFFTGVLQLLFNTADLIVVGRFGSALSVGAVGSTSSLVHLIINMFMGLSSGIGVATATAIGEGDDEAVRKTVHTAIPLSVVCGVIINVIMFIFAEPILRLMDTPSDVIELSAVYLKIYSFGMVPCMIYNFSAAILRAEGDTSRPLIFLTLSGVINVVLNLIFVICFKMDVAGVALATAISQAVSAVLVVLELKHRNDASRLRLRKMHFHLSQLKKIIIIGVPAGIQAITFSLSNVIIQSSINSFGSIAVSGSAAAASVDSFVYAGTDAFQQTAMNFAGQNHGAKKPERVHRTLMLCIACVIVTELLLGGLAFLFSKPLISFYIPNSPESVIYGSKRMMFTALCYFIAGIMQMLSNTIRGMGHSLSPMLISIFSNCVFRMFWVFAVFNNAKGSAYAWEILFSSYPISWTIAIILGIIVYINVIKKEKKLLMAPHHN